MNPSFIEFLEVLSLITGVIFIILAVRELYIAWLFGFISSCALLVIYIKTGFIFNSALMAYYIIVALYGFWSWRQKKIDGSYQVPIKKLGLIHNVGIILCGSILSLIFFVLVQDIGTSPFLDSVIFSFSVLATYLQVKKYIDNWLYWILLNILSIGLMILSELYWLSLLMSFYLLMSYFGYVSWSKLRVCVADQLESN